MNLNHLIFQAHVLLHFINSTNSSKNSSWKQRNDLNSDEMLNIDYLKAHIAESCKTVSNSYAQFKNKALEQASENYFFPLFRFSASKV